MRKKGMQQIRLLQMFKSDSKQRLIEMINNFIQQNNIVIINYDIEPHASEYEAVVFYQVQPEVTEPEDSEA